MASSPPPSPPLIHSPGTNTFPVITIPIIGILATALLLISYYIFVIKCCLNLHRVYFFNRFFSGEQHPTHNSSAATTTVSPDIRATVKKGLDESIIRSIPMIKFRKLTVERKVVQDTLPEPVVSYECAVCLCEFEEGETLRVIPNCCHAFHIDCIDVWLQSNANCPLCRSGISPALILCNAQMFGFDKSDGLNANGESNDDDDFVVIEIEGNNLDEPRLVSTASSVLFCLSHILPETEKNGGKKGRRKLGHVYSMGDELIDMRKKDDEEFEIEPIRRSISMDLSNERDFCIEIQESWSNREESEVSCDGDGSSSKVRRSIFSFGYGRSSRCSAQPVHLDP